MFTEHDLRELVEFVAPAPVLSLYLNTDPSEGNADFHRLRARSMLKDINLPQDVEAIHRYLDFEYPFTGGGVAIFSCAQEGFFRGIPLAVPVRNAIHVGDRPSVKILAGLLDSYGGYGVVLVDKQGARLFYFHMGTLVEQEGIIGEAIKQVKRGGASSMPGRRGGIAGRTRAVEEQIERNMKDTVEYTTRFFEHHKVRRILIAGTDENVQQFRSHLPKSWLSLVVGTFPMSMTASHSEVLQRAMQVGNEAEKHREERLIEDLITFAAKGAGAVVGLEDSLQAVNQGRVQTLVISEGFRKVGYRERETDFLTTQPSEEGINEGRYIKVYDVVELAVNHTLRSGGDVEVVMQAEKMEKAGNIGAFLRF